MKFIFISLLFFLIFGILIKLKKKNDWLNYRLGDILRGWFKKKESNNYLDDIEKRIPNSIGGKYIKKTKGFKAGIYYNELNSILNELDYEKPDKNDVVIHLRIGDSIVNVKDGVINYLKNSNEEIYATVVENLEEILKKFDKSKRFVLVYGSHKKLSFQQKINNRYYLSKVRRVFKKYNLKVINKKNKNPDKDFYYMTHSKIFINSGGGFSAIISNIVVKRGGVVYSPNNMFKKNNFTWGGENWN